MQRYDLAQDFTDSALELSLLAAITSNPSIYFSVIENLSVETFAAYPAEFERIAVAIEDRQEHLPVVDAAPAPDPVEASKRLADLAQKRMLATLTQKTLLDLRTDKTAADLRRDLESGLVEHDHAVRQLRCGQLTSIGDLLPEVFKEFRTRYELMTASGQAVAGISTGFPKLDEMIGGLQREGGLMVLAAPPGAGKTSFALQILRNVTRLGHVGLFVSYEERIARLAAKVIASEASLELKRFQDGLSDPSLLEDAGKRLAPIFRTMFFHEANTKTTLSEIRVKFQQALHRTGATPGILLIDYLQLATKAVGDQQGEYRHAVDALVTGIREMSHRIKVPCLVLAAQNRANFGTSNISSFRDSSSVEYGADQAMFLVEDDDRQLDPPLRALQLTVAKNRQGDVGSIPFIFDPAKSRFEEVHESSVSY
jgi:replicative DNA helicase